MANRRRGTSNEKKGSPEWMTTYGDMVTLLLCFFVLLFAFSEIDAQKFEAIIQSFKGSLGVLEGGKTIEEVPYIDTDSLTDRNLTTEQIELEDFKALYKKIDEYVQENGLSAQIFLSLEERGLLIRFSDNVLFDSAKAELKPEARMILDEIGKVLIEINKYIRVEGHTDNIPISTPQFPSNWELSTTRATNVLHYLINSIGLNPRSLSASGYSEYHPVGENNSLEGRAKNRRVDIVIMRSSHIKSEPYH